MSTANGIVARYHRSLVVHVALALALDLVRFVALAFRSHGSLAAENLFLRKQLAYYLERQVKPRRADTPTRLTLVLLGRFVDWQLLLTLVQPDTFLRWHRRGYRLFWRWKSRARGRPPIPVDLQRLIASMAIANRTWGEERIAAELRLKLGITVSPRTVRRYMPRRGPSRGGSQSPSWRTFLRNHASEVLACDFFVAVTAGFRRVYVFVVLDITTRRIVHWNVTRHPTAEWTVQQFRNCITSDEAYRFLIHDHDAIYAPAVDSALTSMHVRVVTTPVRVPQANAFCERAIGTVRRECLDWVIPLNERHLRRILAEWVNHYNDQRPHSALGPGVPAEPLTGKVLLTGHDVSHGYRVAVRSVLGGLHHEYRLEPLAA